MRDKQSEEYRKKHRAEQARYVARNRAAVRARRREYESFNREAICARSKERRKQNPLSRELRRRYRLAVLAKSPNRIRASRSMAQFLKRRGAYPTKCLYNNERCGGRMECHHTDYSKPKEVIGMCKWHHAAWHRVLEAVDGETR